MANRIFLLLIITLYSCCNAADGYASDLHETIIHFDNQSTAMAVPTDMHFENAHFTKPFDTSGIRPEQTQDTVLSQNIPGLGSYFKIQFYRGYRQTYCEYDVTVDFRGNIITYHAIPHETGTPVGCTLNKVSDKEITFIMTNGAGG